MNLTPEQRIVRLEKAVNTLRTADVKRYNTYYMAVKKRMKDRARIEAKARALVRTYSQTAGVISRFTQLASYLRCQLVRGRGIMTFSATERQKLMRILKEDARKKNDAAKEEKPR